MLARSSRSRSRTAEAPSKNSLSFANSPSTSPSSRSLRSNSPLSNPTRATDLPVERQNGMISTITGRKVAGTRDPMVLNDRTAATADQADSRSSSLSDLDVDDGSEDELDTITVRSPLQSAADGDSEAETERLEKTPRKPVHATDGTRQVDEKSPSKLSQEISRGKDVSDSTSIIEVLQPPSPSEEPSNHNDATSPVPAEGSSTLGKRKRSSPGGSPLSDVPTDEPSPKRTNSKHDTMENDLEVYEDVVKEQDAESDMEDDKAIDVVSSLDEPEINEEAEDESHTAPQEVEPAPQRGRPGRKGRRKGRKAVIAEEPENPAEVSDAIAQEPEEQAENEVEEEEDNSHDEELAKRKVASDALADIEKDFTAFRERHVREQLRQVTHELELLQNLNYSHPDFLAQLRCVDRRRGEKTRYEDTFMHYNLQALSVKTVAERGQFLSQYYQDIRHTRDEDLDNSYKELYALQKDRRQFGTDETNYAMIYNPKRPQQILQQMSFNLEVSILSGIAKHVGFPAAPEMSALTIQDADHDLQSMGIKNPPATQFIRTHSSSYLDAARADRSLAEEQFLEQTPWANPQHPVHSQVQINSFHAQGGSLNLTTPAAQRRFVDANATNGSASTIEMMSNPPSSAAGPQHHALDHFPGYDPVDSPIPSNRAPSGSLFSRVSSRQDLERIQTTHSSSARSQAALLAGTSFQGPPIPQKMSEMQLQLDQSNHGPQQAIHNVAARMSSLEASAGSRAHISASLLGNSPNSTGLPKSIGTEGMRPSPPRQPVTASVGGGGGRFGS